MSAPERSPAAVAVAEDFPALERVFPGTLLTRSRKDPVNLVEAVFTTLGEQTVTVIGTETVELVVPRVAGQIKELNHQRAIVADEVEKLLNDFALSQVLMSMPATRPQRRYS